MKWGRLLGLGWPSEATGSSPHLRRGHPASRNWSPMAHVLTKSPEDPQTLGAGKPADARNATSSGLPGSHGANESTDHAVLNLGASPRKEKPPKVTDLRGQGKYLPSPRMEQQTRRHRPCLRGRFAPCAARHGNATCSHPDYTVGPGLSPVSCLGPVGLGSRAEEVRETPSITAGRELAARRRPHPAPQVVVIQLYGTADPWLPGQRARRSLRVTAS